MTLITHFSTLALTDLKQTEIMENIKKDKKKSVKAKRKYRLISTSFFQ